MARDAVLLEKFNDGNPDPDDGKLKTRWRFANGHWESCTRAIAWDNYTGVLSARILDGTVDVFRKKQDAQTPYEFVVVTDLFGHNDRICVGRLPDVLYLLRLLREATNSLQTEIED